MIKVNTLANNELRKMNAAIKLNNCATSEKYQAGDYQGSSIKIVFVCPEEHSFDMTVLSTYRPEPSNLDQIPLKLNFGHNSPYSILRRNDRGKYDNVSLALNDALVETSY
jgi:hypothetical protein